MPPPHPSRQDHGHPARHCLRDLPVTEVRAAAPLAVTVGLHLWRRDALLSVLGGIAVHVLMTSALFG
ncbi:hypothetical protein [Streptomyces sp. NPDC093105]|uniref:hypothetical protein n=1 Tax=Streptomyces sp. NPDC093105 TaxID=3366029 RepID=UPI0038151F08